MQVSRGLVVHKRPSALVGALLRRKHALPQPVNLLRAALDDEADLRLELVLLAIAVHSCAGRKQGVRVWDATMW